MAINLYGNMNLMNSALDGFSMRNTSISKNLANINTPGYKRETVSFEDELRKISSQKSFETSSVSLRKTDKNHLGFSSDTNDFKPRVSKEKNYSTRRDGNNVDADIEMIDLAKTNIMYSALTDQINRRFTKLQSVIAEGGK